MNKKCSTDTSIWMLFVSVTASPIQTHILRLDPGPKGVTKPSHFFFPLSLFCLLLCLLLCRISLMVSKFFLQLCGYISPLSHSADVVKYLFPKHSSNSEIYSNQIKSNAPWTNYIWNALLGFILGHVTPENRNGISFPLATWMS